MAITMFRAMLNAEPHHFVAEFNEPYEQLKASDILKKAAKFLEDYFTHHGDCENLPEDVRSRLLLRYLTKEDAFAVSSEHQPGSPISELFPNPYTRLATDWYRTTGYNLSSVAVKDDALLASVAPLQDTTRIRWYILLSVALGLKSYYGPDPILLDPIFAEAYNLFSNPNLVKLEEGPRQPDFDIHNVVSKFRTVCNMAHTDEREFNSSVVSVLKLLLDFTNLELHFPVYDDNHTQVTEIDWLSFCHTVHGLPCVLLSGEGKKECNTGGDAVLQNFLSLQRLFAVFEKLRHYQLLTGCSFVVLTVEGSVLNVWFGYFGDKLYGARFFTFDLLRSACGSSVMDDHDLAVKLQIVRNTVRKLHRRYVNLHACTRLPTPPYLFPQPLSLLQCLIPSPAPEVVDSLASLKLNFLKYCRLPMDSSRCLYQGDITQSGKKLHVYVKFVPKYGEAAHRLLAEQDPPLAPKLYWCGEVIIGKTMVVMEELGRGKRHIYPRKYNTDDIEIIRRDIRRALDVLHENGLVHGDVRDPNMVIAHGRGYLIDFDSAGEEGVARYPESLNPEVAWFESIAAKDLALRRIRKEHDNFRFERTVEELLGLHDTPKRAWSEGEEGQGNKERWLCS
ncbi:hypothetical protein LXA43DRAFT_911505 [Ganoderma leucocontextum]|nr:hypothetical protein LXA43DRAFT_911505 [Ganoderma leucocontextum]